ncbi:MAG: glycoside hydrolase family 3 N-terminal domain-containing protein [Gemmatimonadaceae bacterium]
MSLRDKAAQMVWPWMLGDYLADNDPASRRLESYVTTEHVGGFIVSLGAPFEIAQKLNALQRLSALPLIVGADYEYGAGMRARGAFFLPNAIDLGGAVTLPPQMALGATGDTALAYEVGRVTAIEGRALGVHLDFTPVLDVNNNPANPVISTRSFGEDPRQVARLGAAEIRGLQEHGMLATGKHFPGHGDTETNSHLAMAVVTASRARLDTLELVPFRAAIAAGVSTIMTFHGALPALDSATVPATLSRRIMTGLLRDELHFGGLIVSDAMDMQGVLGRYGLAEACKRAVDAGVDVLLMPADIRGCIDAVVAGVVEGRFSEQRIDQSVHRLFEMKARLGLDRRRFVDLDSVRALVGDTAHAGLARLIAERSITIVKDSLRQLPLSQLPRASRLLSIGYSQRAELYANGALDAELRRAFPVTRSQWINSDDPATNYPRLLAMADSADIVIVASYLGHSSTMASIGAPKAFSDFVNDLVQRGRHPIVVAMGNPYFLQQVPATAAYVVGWMGFPVSQTAMGRALVGAAPVTGRLPIRIPPFAAIGAGESRASSPPPR